MRHRATMAVARPVNSKKYLAKTVRRKMVGTRRPRGNARPLGYAALLLLAVPLVLASLAGCEAAKPAVKAEPKGEPDLLEKAAKFISAQKTFQVAVDIEMRVEAQGQKQVVKTAYSLSAERPNRVAMRMKTGEFGVTLVSDGKVFLRGIANQKRYMVSESPDSVSEVFNDPSTSCWGWELADHSLVPWSRTTLTSNSPPGSRRLAIWVPRKSMATRAKNSTSSKTTMIGTRGSTARLSP